MSSYILSLDQGTTSSRAIAFNQMGQIAYVAQQEFKQIYPQSGWVEHNPIEIYTSQLAVAKEVIDHVNQDGGSIQAIGITNQRETIVVWDKTTGQPIYNALVWQDRRTAQYCDELKEAGYEELIQDKTGLVIDAYFSATKIKWILDNVSGAREKAEKGNLCCGTIDTWLVWNLSQGKSFVTDVSNASRTMMYNIHQLQWDDELLTLFDIPTSMLPAVRSSSEIYAHTSQGELGVSLPIAGIAGDQQAALFGQQCLTPGQVKNTYGTGCFLLMNTGTTPVKSKNRLLTTIAWQRNNETHYALEGSVFIGGAAVQWIRDGLQLIENASEIEDLAKSVDDNDGVYFVPALSGLGAPYWDQYARGAILGIYRGTTKGHIARATLEGIAYRVFDIVEAMQKDSGVTTNQLMVDGGAVVNNFLMQFQADIFQFEVTRPVVLETTALGVAYLAGLATNYWTSTEDIQNQQQIDKRFYPTISQPEQNKLISKWRDAVSRVQGWAKE